MEARDAKEPGGQRLLVEGTLGIADVAALKGRILEALRSCRELELDLGAVEECDTAGIQLLVATGRLAEQDGRAVRLGRCSEAVGSAAARLGVSLMTSDSERGD